MTAPFVHLRLHTEYSLSDGIVRIEPLLARALELDMPAVAITDIANLFGMVKFYRAALDAGVKPVVGVDLWLRGEGGDPPSRLTLLCQDRIGYRNLCEILTDSYLHGQHRGRALTDPAWLAERSAGLIALSGGVEGDVGRALLAGKREAAEKAAGHWAWLFEDRYYLELTRTGRENEEACLAESVSLALDLNLPVTATNDVRFLHAGDFEAHEARVCIHEGHTLYDPRRPRRYSAEQYLKSPAEMAEVFADLPEALENTAEIARRCNLELSLGENFLPRFPVPEGHDAASYLRERAAGGLDERLTDLYPDADGREAERPAYDERLEHELHVIESMGYPGYFLIVADFIDWARDNGVPVGPGRGSGAGSLVAYSLGITDLDPLAYDLLFERFLNPDRVSMPDFDIDFCMEGRDRVIEYVAERYGQDKVSQIITYGTMAARAVVRDVGRVLGHPYGYVDKIAKQVPFAIDMTLERALEESGELRNNYQGDEEVRYLIDLARALEGLCRNPGKHAGGVVIAPDELIAFTPLYCEPNGGNRVTQFDKDDVEAVGLVKFDFLGLRTLTIIDRAVRIANERLATAGGAPIDVRALPLDDDAAFDLLRSGHTTAVFQLESAGMRRLIKRLRPNEFEDIVALVALYRPGPLESGMVEDFNARKNEGATVTYPHPSLEPILEPTYGVILYQEQVMQIARELSGYSLAEADLLRRAMGKKKPEEMAKQRAGFLEGAKRRGVDEGTASHIFDLIEKFAGYGFNKCLHGDTEIVDADTGEVHHVEELFRRRDALKGRLRVHSLDSDHKLRPRIVEDIVWNGVKPVYRLITRSGRRLVATGNHPLRTFDGWKNLGALKVGDAVAAPRGLSVNSSVRWQAHEIIALAGRDPDRQALDAYLDINTGPRSSRDTVPADIRKWVNEERRAAGLTWRELEARSGLSMKEFYGSGSAGKKGFRRSTISRLAAVLSSCRLAEQAESDIFWDEVLEIERVGLAETYDLTVEGNHNFIADGLIVHNSHSAAYALVSYQTAWLKAHHPAAFMCAVLSADMDNTDKIVTLIDECQRMGIEVLAPDINASAYDFSVVDETSIRYGLGAIKGVGRAAIETMLAERESGGPFEDLYGFCRRIDTGKINRRVLEALTRAGALDALGPNRASLMQGLPRALAAAEQDRNAKEAGQDDMFGLEVRDAAQPAVHELETLPEWPEAERLRAERDTLGLYLTGHPINAWESELARFTSGKIGDLVDDMGRPGEAPAYNGRRGVVVAGLVVEVRRVRRGRRVVFVLDDRSARIECVLFEEKAERYAHLLQPDKLLVVEGTLSYDDFTEGYRLNPTELLELDVARERYAARILLQLSDERRIDFEELAGALERYRTDAGCGIVVRYRNASARAVLTLEDTRVRVCEALIDDLRGLGGVEAVAVRYRRGAQS